MHPHHQDSSVGRFLILGRRVSIFAWQPVVSLPIAWSSRHLRLRARHDREMANRAPRWASASSSQRTCRVWALMEIILSSRRRRAGEGGYGALRVFVRLCAPLYTILVIFITLLQNWPTAIKWRMKCGSQVQRLRTLCQSLPHQLSIGRR